MPCFNPRGAWKDAQGQVHVGRAVDLAETFGSAHPNFQFHVPCGQCIGCRADRAQDWTLRILHEAQLYGLENSFITLTYDDAHVPKGYQLELTDWQLFAKRLRHTGPFRFYAVGEYGDDLGRPHFHACLFGRSFRDDRSYWRTNEHGDKIYRSPTLEKAWKNGYAEIGNLEYKSAAYVARYCMKKLTGPETSRYQGRTPPFAVMSRGGQTGFGGIGKRWLDHFMDDVYPHDEVVTKGRKHRPPRYYDQQLDDQVLQQLKEKRIAKAKEHKENNTPQRLKEREEHMRITWKRKR